MIIRSIRILNYKCFDDSGRIEFGERLNLIVGQNNSGKTALFDCFDLQRFADKPHRDLSSRQYEMLNPTSSLETQICFSGDELHTLLMATGDTGLIVTLKGCGS
jgi:DNA repair exonuclease SbcCD ATPase subunit